ncbi:MAG: CBS domain-containing protein [Eubacteriales bacterium]
MLKEKRVGDVMKPVSAYPSVYPDATLAQTLTAILNSQGDAKFALVADRGKFVGIVGADEIIDTIRPGIKNKYYRGYNLSEWSLPVYMEGLFTQKCRAASMEKVSEIMSPVEETLHAGDTLSKAVDLLHKNSNGWVPVVERGQVIGVLSYYDIMEEINSTISREKLGDVRTGAAAAAGI